ncbi:hypothetical protein [Rhizobium leguminosarum]|uniref:hypothetical protein n=1 Tax=Rhizobium leguminosarum TaxID=384 RepID=UPI003F9D1843
MDENDLAKHMALYALANNPAAQLDLPQVLELAKLELSLTHRPEQNVMFTSRWDFEHYESAILRKRLGEFHPFAEIESTTLHFAGGSATFGQNGALSWVARRLVSGVSVEDIIAEANSNYAENGYEAMEVTKVVGITVDSIVELIPGYELWPPEQLPSDYRKRIAFETDGVGIRSASAALVHRFWHGPVYGGPNPFDLGSDITKLPLFQKLAKQAEKRQHLRRALLLCVDCAVELPITYYCGVTDHILSCERSYQFTNEPFTLVARQPDISQVKSCYIKLEKFKQPAALAVALDRLGRARTSPNNVDKALDLGMALEVALMHENGSNSEANTEITYKVSTRASWLLGEEPEGRRQAFATAKKIYAHRSKAVHSGCLKDEADFIALNADDFVQRTIMQLLNRGEFPKWGDLVLGLG